MNPTGPVLGCIADDFTGAVDVAASTAAAGLDTVVVTDGAPSARASDADVVVIALKSRTAQVGQAVAASLDAARALLDLRVQQLYFKYCSTFDSTPAGNIGPVADALAQLVAAAIVVVAPGYPAQRRTVRSGQLFVGNQLLADSPMRSHPLTPMTSSDLPGLLTAQSRFPVGSIELEVVHQGAGAVADALARLAPDNRYAVLDSVTDADIAVIADAAQDHALVTGGAALASALATRAVRVQRTKTDPIAIPIGGRSVLSGSCSAATQRQVAAFTGPALFVDPRRLDDAARAVTDTVRWASQFVEDEPILITTTVGDSTLLAIHRELGRELSASLVEGFFAALAPALLDVGFNRIVVAGGETSGAVTAGLQIGELVVATAIGPGLAWCVSENPRVALALKSGNFGDDDVFVRAHTILDEASSRLGSAL